MRLSWLLLLLLLTACDDSRPQRDATVFSGAAPPPTRPPASLPAVAGADVASGKILFRKLCAGCHGASGRGDGPLAGGLAHAPTDLTRENYLCRTTVGAQPVPSLADVEGALERGTHRTAKQLAALDAAERRSLTLSVASLAPGFARAPLPLLAVPGETGDSLEDRRRGRLLYLALGCWKCHGATGSGPGTLTASWNGRVLPPRPLADHDGALCGSTPTRVYQTLSLGLGAAPVAMPGYGEYVELLARPRDGDPASWTKSLTGKVEDLEVTQLREFYENLPDRATVHALTDAARRERGAAFLWSLTHYVRSL